MAKLECLDEVTVRHVKEAKRLLTKSIVTVEQPDIDLEEAEDGNMDVNTDDAPPLMAALNAMDNNDQTAETPGKLFYFVYKILLNHF